MAARATFGGGTAGPGANRRAAARRMTQKRGAASGAFSGGKLGAGAAALGKIPGAKAGAVGFKAPAAAPPAKPVVGQHAAPDSIYNNTVELANRKQDYALGALDTQERGIKHSFGIEDPTDPFSRANGLKRLYLARMKGTSASLAAQGHLYSGQHQRALARVRLDQEQAQHDLRAAYEDAINQIGSQKAGVKFDTEEQRNQAFQDWLARAEDAGATAPAPAPAAGGSAKAAPAPAAPPVAPAGTNRPTTVIGHMSPGKLGPNAAAILLGGGKGAPAKGRGPKARPKPRPKAHPKGGKGKKH